LGQRLHHTDANGGAYTSQVLQSYVTSFLSNLGGTSWAAIQDEYCNNVPVGTTSCAAVGGGNYVTNPRKQLKGVWTDPTPVPSDIVTLGLAENLVDDPLAMEAIRASAHFGYDPRATYIILTPPTTIGTGQPVYCGYHTQTRALTVTAIRIACNTPSSRSSTRAGRGLAPAAAE